jgi:hypothetical protein
MSGTRARKHLIGTRNSQSKPLGVTAVAHKSSYSNNVKRSGREAPHGRYLLDDASLRSGLNRPLIRSRKVGFAPTSRPKLLITSFCKHYDAEFGLSAGGLFLGVRQRKQGDGQRLRNGPLPRSEKPDGFSDFLAGLVPEFQIE